MATQSFASKTVLLIGATGGIGGALAQEFARKNCKLALVGRKEAVLKNLRNHLPQVESDYWQCDVRSYTSVLTTYESIIKRFGSPDIVIFASGIGEVMDSLNFSAELFEDTIMVNLISLGYWLECILPQMIQRRQGVIVGISSLAACRGLPRGTAYCPSKAGVSVLFECLRIDLLQFGIHVLLVEPGFVATSMSKRLPFKPYMITAKAAAKQIIRAIENGRSRIRFPWPMRLYAAVLRLLPRVVFDHIMGPDHPARAPLCFQNLNDSSGQND